MLNSGLCAVLKGVWAPAMQWILVTVASSFLSWLLRKVLFSRAAAQSVGSQPIQACKQHAWGYSVSSPAHLFPCLCHLFFEYLLQHRASCDQWNYWSHCWVNGHGLLLLPSVHCVAVLPWSPLLGIQRMPMVFTAHNYSTFPKKEWF